MKTMLRYALAATLILSVMFPSVLTAQEYIAPQVVISKDKVRTGGKIYYAHPVLERQTLYSISKAYGVTQEEIIEANPLLNLEKEGLKKGQVLLIPFKEETTQSAQPQEVQEEITVETPAPRENVEKEKVSKKASRNRDNADGEYFIHKVRWYDDLDAIAKKYGVSKESIKNINKMTSDKIYRKQELKIPTDPAAWEGGSIKEEDTQTTPSTEVTATGFPATTGEEENPSEGGQEDGILDDLFVREGNHKVNISMLLPFSAPKSGDRTSFMDLYCGSLLAARELGAEGVNLDIHSYDIAGGNMPVTRERLSESDFTIGPVSKTDVTKASRISEGDSWIVSPLDMQVEPLADTLSKIIQAPTPTSVQIRDMVQWIKSDLGRGDKVIVVTPASQHSTYHDMVESEMENAGLAHSTTTLGSMKALMTSQGTNRIVLSCDYTERSTVFLIEAVRNLFMSAGRSGSIVLYSTSRIRTYDQIDVEQLHKLNLHASVTYFVDYNSKKTKDFLLQYRALYNTEPSRSAYSGYDLMMFFGNLANKYGKKWPKALHKVDFDGLQSDFKLERTPSGSYINNAVRRVVYNPDYSITLVR